MAKRTALVTGVTGQDGAYLVRRLLARGDRVVGGFRRTSSGSFWRLEDLGVLDHPDLRLAPYDATDGWATRALVEDAEPDEIYNFAAQSFVGASFDQPVATAEATGIGAVHLFEAVRRTGAPARVFQASTSEMFGKVAETPQRETTPFHPRSPYGAAKLYAHAMGVNYREAHGLFIATAIMFNHESPLRGREFVTRKITDAAARIRLGLASEVRLGNLDARRDWGFADEYMAAAEKVLRLDAPDTFVLATGVQHTVRDFAGLAFAAAGVDLVWRGEGADEEGVDRETGRTLVRIDPALIRPAEVDTLLGDPSKAERALGWRAETGVEALARMMVEADLARLKRGGAA